MEDIEFYDIEEGEILDGELDSPKNSDNECLTFPSNGRISCSVNNVHFSKEIPNAEQSNCFERNNQKLSHLVPYGSTDNFLNLFSYKDHKLNADRSKLFVPGSNSTYYGGNNNEKPRENNVGIYKDSAEDIMFQIDEVVCRKKRYSEPKIKKSRSVIYKQETPHEKEKCSYKVKTKSMKKKRKSDKCRVCLYDSTSPGRAYDEVLYKKKKLYHKKVKIKTTDRNYYYCNYDSDDYDDSNEGYAFDNNDADNKIQSANSLKKYVRDFDEVRKNLLEKLMREKVESTKQNNQENPSHKTDAGNSKAEFSFFDSSNLSMTNAGNNELNQVTENKGEADEEMDLAHLRLVALASNRKKKRKIIDDDTSKPETPPNGIELSDTVTSRDDATNEREKAQNDGDFDRNELLLRAEALKTALLKKHKKRINRVQTSKSDFKEENFMTEKEEKLKRNITITLDGDCLEESGILNVDAKEESKKNVVITNEVHKKVTLEDDSSKKKFSKTGYGKIKNRKRKTKTCALLSHVKENEGREGPSLEEDCQSLRSQLLCDLIKKKSSMSFEKKPVLLDSMLRSANNVIAKRDDNLVTVGVKSYPHVTKKENDTTLTTKPGAAPKVPEPEIQRVIIHLGSEDSSEDDLGDDSKNNEKSNPVSEGKETTDANEACDEGANATDEDFGDNCKKVMLLLGQTRKLVDEEQQKARENKLAVAEAIYKHLPLSQRLEYFRLKQKIAEREKERKKKRIFPCKSVQDTCKTTSRNVVVEKSVSSGSSHSSNSRVQSYSVTTDRKPASTLTGSVKRSPRSVSSGQLPHYSGAPSRILSNQMLISKLKFLLKKVKIEKTIEENYNKEITKLKGQLMLFEKRKSEQRFKIKKLVEESVKTYNQMSKPIESNFQSPKTEEPKSADVAGNNQPIQVMEGIGELQKSTAEKEEKGVPLDISKEAPVAEKIDRNNQMQRPSNGTPDHFIQYNSPLEAFTRGSETVSEKLNPNIIMCQFDIAGVCKDEECSYQHYRANAE